jgi:signal transduction histidine kinase
MSEIFETSKDVTRLQELYFSQRENTISLKKGDALLSDGIYNDKLFLILEGTLSGFLEDANGEMNEVFKSTKNMFVGVYSFFSPDHVSYLTMVADEPTSVAFITQQEKNRPDFASDFLPVIVQEIYLRQVLTQQLTSQRQAAIKKLYENEKMATLGMLAAGLAHELNNAIGVLQRNTEWLIESFDAFLKNKKLNAIFETSLEEGLTFSTSVLRERRQSLEKDLGIPTKLAKQLAKTNLDEAHIASLLKGNASGLDMMSLISETGRVMHDMRIAAAHSTHVVQSVRELGFSATAPRTEVSLHESITKSLALVKSLLTGVQVEVIRNADGKVNATMGDLVQVWVNLIKNACESIGSSDRVNPKIVVAIDEQPESYIVTVSDNGPGISPEVLAKIFEPNFTTKVRGLSFGLGLGLSIVKRIVSDYKGTISVSSEFGDTRFTVFLPKTSHRNKD